MFSRLIYIYCGYSIAQKRYSARTVFPIICTFICSSLLSVSFVTGVSTVSIFFRFGYEVEMEKLRGGSD